MYGAERLSASQHTCWQHHTAATAVLWDKGAGQDSRDSGKIRQRGCWARHQGASDGLGVGVTCCCGCHYDICCEPRCSSNNISSLLNKYKKKREDKGKSIIYSKNQDPNAIKEENEQPKEEEKENNINLEIYKLQKELNKRLPKKKRKKVKKNYEEIIRKWKLEKGPPKEYLKLNLDPYDMLYMDDAKKEQQNFNERKEEQNKKNEVKTKDNYLDRGLSKLKKRIKELEKLDKNDEKNETRKNKEIIKREKYLEEK